LFERFFFFEIVWQTKSENENLKQKNNKTIRHLAFLSAKYSVQLSEIFDSLVSANEHGTATCASLAVEYRGNTGKEAIFLITQDDRIVVQFRISMEYLLRKDLRFESWMNTDKIRRQLAKQACGANVSTVVRNLRYGMKEVNVEAEVLAKPNPSFVRTRFGSSAAVTNAWVGDETGKIKLCLWNDQASCITIGDIVEIRNASVKAFRGERQLSLGKKGTVTVSINQTGRAEQKLERTVETPVCA